MPTTPEDWCPPTVNPTSESGSQSDSGLPPGDRFDQRYSNPLPALCGHRLQRLLITGALRDALTQHFSRPERFDPSLRRILWTDTPASGILVESVYRWKPEEADKRPALMIRANAVRRIRVGILDSAGVSSAGHPQYGAQWVGSHTVFALSSLVPQVEALAAEASSFLDHFGAQMRSGLKLQDFHVLDVGAPGKLKTAPQDWGIPVTVAWAYMDVWRTDYESVTMRAIDFQVLTGG